jgi:predicted PurR-regulated permease PerM
MTDREFTRRLTRVVTTIVLTAAALFVIWIARDALVLVYISVLLATGFGPVVYAIEHQTTARGKRQRVPRWLAILVIYVVIVGGLTVVGLLVVPPLVSQARELWTGLFNPTQGQDGRILPSLFDRVQSFLIDRGLLSERLTLSEAMRRAPGTPGEAVGTIATALSTTVSGIFGIITILILTFYLLLESDSLFAGFARLFPRAERGRVEETANKISTKVSAWLNGQLILAGTIGISAAIGLALLNVPYFYVLALLAGVGEIIPIIGPILSAIPAVAVGFTVSAQTGFFVLIFFIAQQQVENHVLVPKVMERQVGVSAVTVIVALLVGGSLLGILGAILAVPTAAILQVVVQEVLDERDRLEERAHRP